MTPLGQGQWLDLHCLHGHQRGPGLGRARGGDRHQGPALAGAHLLLLSEKSGMSNFRTEPYLVRPGLTDHDCLAGGDDLLAEGPGLGVQAEDLFLLVTHLVAVVLDNLPLGLFLLVLVLEGDLPAAGAPRHGKL